MEPRKVFHTTEYPLPRTSFTMSGYSRASYRSGFYINGLGICLDAGPQMFKRVSHYFVTHCHTDHIANLPYSLIGDSEIETADGKIRPIIYCPKETAELLDEKILSSFRANCGTKKADDRIRTFYEIKPTAPDETIEIVANKQKLVIRTWDADHSVPTRVYGISMVKKKLKPEYSHLPKNDLGKLARSGTQLSGIVEEPFISYIMDTSIHTLEDSPELLDYPTVIIECTFLFDGEEDMAEDKKHIHWTDLLPYIQARPETTFILTHFSLRYTDEEIQDFFREQIRDLQLQNIYPWLTDIQFSLEDHEKNVNELETYEDSVIDNMSVYDRQWAGLKTCVQIYMVCALMVVVPFFLVYCLFF